jgi:hypothetical protein
MRDKILGIIRPIDGSISNQLATHKSPMNTTLPKTSSTRFGGICLAILIASISVKSGFAQSTEVMSNQVRDQISSIMAMKSGFNAAEQKMSSNLVFRSRLASGKSIGAASSFTDSAKAQPSTTVNVTLAGRISPDLLQFIQGNGGTVTASSEKYGRLDAMMPLSAIPVVAGHADVNWIRESLKPRTNVGALTTQGLITHQANGLAVQGAGVKVGVMSDSASPGEVATLQASGDLGPNTTVLSGQDGTNFPGFTDEGCAMMEIVQDIAPKAQIFFATAFSGPTGFANNIAALGAAGCSIVCDDVTYFEEGAFQDDVIAQAVNSYVNAGGLYFSSAANSGNLDSGTSGTWEGDFVNGGNVGAPVTSQDASGKYHAFAPGQNYDVLTVASEFISLKWSDRLGGSNNDYDLFILDSTGTTIKASSTDVQNGTQDPVEIVDYNSAAGDRVVVVKFSGNARALRVDTNRGQLSIATARSTFGHNAGTNTVGMAAVYWNSQMQGAVPFSSAATVETFSSDGPRRFFYNANGSAITPGNFLFNTNGGFDLQQPVMTAADGADSKTPGFFGFFGTSAATPHAAGIAALVKSAQLNISNSGIRTIMTNTALDIMASGVDRDTGVGITLAKPAVAAATGP